MPDMQQDVPSNLDIPRSVTWDGQRCIAGPSYASFTSRFGDAFPKPHFLTSDLGTTAVYELPPPSAQSKRQVLIVHGANTPALGMLALAQELQALDADAHVVLFDLWGHGLSSTPLVAHTPQIFHSQIHQVLGFMQWTRANLLGFSFGGVTVLNFTRHNPWAVQSVGLLAPAGLLSKDGFSQEMQELLDSRGRDTEAINCVLSWLEGGPLVVPSDWQEQARSGKIIAEALREWALQEHRGYGRSILSLFRDGQVYGADDKFRAFAKQPVKKIVILAEQDFVCSKDQLVKLGFGQVEVVQNHDHAFVRTAPSEVARIVHQFWMQAT